jgi:hypothetical protein
MCAVGRYQDGTAQSSCKACDTGKYQLSKQQAACTMCLT